MVSEAPPFWWTRRGWQAIALLPLSFLYGRVAGWRMGVKSRNSVPVPVICVGNFTVGGAGKTPTAAALAREAKARGLQPGILSRGYGGSLDVTTLVDADHHRAADVGDEPLLLAREAVTVVARRRIAGARMLVEQGVDLIIMDDGFQSNSLVTDFALIVIDSRRGIGNGHVVPGGPVRAPIGRQMRRLSAILKVGNGDAADKLVRRASRSGKQVFVATLKPKDDEGLAGLGVLAFAGIGDPEKFYRTLSELNILIEDRQDFPDHHHLADDEIVDLLTRADAKGLQIVTTAKDMARLAHGHGRAAELAARCHVIDVDMIFDDPGAPSQIIDRAINACRERNLRRGRS
ncbi:tetraacyldisaccharide 4'-kinase [Agrobacterium sp. ES01]|uniref:tetraacyldisaccharide 4'-kinase n=1 Tax=Agrobacterium sp. ES01 TaxID=3420714 RepID=UPI003D12CEA7